METAPGLSKAKQASADLLFTRVCNDKIFSGTIDYDDDDELLTGVVEEEDAQTIGVECRSFEIGFNDKKTKFIFVWHGGGTTVLGQGLRLVTGDSRGTRSVLSQKGAWPLCLVYSS